MGSVPWQIVYGGWFGWVAAAVLAMVGAALLWLWVRWRARRQAVARRLEVGSATGELAKGSHVLRGRIEVLGAPVPAPDGSGAAAACTAEASGQSLGFTPHQSRARTSLRAPTLRLVTAQGAAYLRGPVEVLAGSHEMHCGRLRSLAPESREQILRESDSELSYRVGSWPVALRVPGIIRCLRHNDEVLVRCLVGPDLPDTSPGKSVRPREDALALFAEARGVIEIAALHPPSVSFSRVTLWTRAAGVGLLLSVSVCWLLGMTARRVGDDETAALFPQHRAWAVESLRERIVSIKDPSRATLEALSADEFVRADCALLGATLHSGGRWEQAGDALATCRGGELASRAVDAYVLAGAFDKACEVVRAYPDTNVGSGRADRAVLFLLGGSSAEASAALRASATAPNEVGQLAFKCVADAIDARAGDAAARERLRTATTEACRLAYADLLDGEARRQSLSYLTEAPPEEQRLDQLHPWIRDALVAGAGGEPELVAAPQLPMVSDLLLSRAVPWPSRAHGLEREVLEQLANQENPSPRLRSLRAGLAVRQAVFSIWSADTAAALRWLDLADRDINLVPANTGEAADQVGVTVERLRARAQVVAVRVLTHIAAGQVDRAAAALGRWNDPSPALLLGELGSDTDAAPATYMREAVAKVVPIIEDARALVVAAGGGPKDARAAGFRMTAHLSLGSHQVDDPAFWSSLAGSDGAALIPLLEASGRGAVALVASRVTSNQDAVAWWLEHHHPTDHGRPEGLEARLSRGLFDASITVRAAAELRRGDLEPPNRAIAKRYSEALLRRDIAVPLALCSLPTPTPELR